MDERISLLGGVKGGLVVSVREGSGEQVLMDPEWGRRVMRVLFAVLS